MKPRIVALSVTDVARVLSAASGEKILPSMIEQDLRQGAPQNGDGSINLIEYTAWLVREVCALRV